MSNHRTREERGFLGGARGGGPLGTDSHRADRHDGLTGPPRGMLVADSGAKEHRRGRQRHKPKPRVKTKEISLVGTFDNPFRKLSDEIAAMKAKRWEPTTDDFAAVAGGNSYQVGSYLEVLGAILVEGNKQRPDGSISRINLFTHANPNLIALGGTVKPLSVGSDVSLYVNSALSQATLDKLNQQGAYFTVGLKKFAKKKFTMDDVRRRFAKGAVIVLYACHSGVDGAFIQYLANTFNVRVRGFSSVIGYFPKYQDTPMKVDRRRVGLGVGATTVHADFHNLDQGTGVIEKTPRP